MPATSPTSQRTSARSSLLFIVGFFFLPRFYQHNVTSVYELIGHEMGSGAQRLASGMFMLGRVFASGARLFIVAIPFSLVAFGDIEPAQLGAFDRHHHRRSNASTQWPAASAQ
jgi:hypothetical protein